MANHGSVAVGTDLEAALQNVMLLEWLAELYQRTRSMGRPRALTPDQQSATIIQAGADLGLGVRDQTIGVMTAMGESSLQILEHGDSAGPDSRAKRGLHRLVAKAVALVGADPLHLGLDVGHA